MTKLTMEEAIDPANPGQWRLFADNGWSKVWELDLGDRIIRKTEWVNADAMLGKIAEQRSKNAGKPWKDGQVVARVPMNLYYASGYAEATKQQDLPWIRKFIRDHPELKTFDGDL